MGQTDDTLTKKVDSYLQKSVANGFSGAVLVARNGTVILSEGYGFAQRENEILVTSSTVFNIGSVTKQFTGAAILKIVDQGKLKTSDTIGTIFPAVPADKKDITIHQLLTHTAGISSNTGGFRYDHIGRDQFLQEVFDAKLATDPGTKHEYANAGYILLAAIIEHVSGKSYETFLYEELFEPAGMLDSGYTRPNWSAAQLAHGYYFSLPDADWVDWGTTPDQWAGDAVSWYGIGKGDLHSTVEDLYKWHQVLESDAVLPGHLRRLYETAFVAENSAETSYYGYGWSISDSERNTKIVAHDGSNGLFFAHFIRFVEEDVVIILLSNVALGDEMGDAAWNIARMVFYPKFQPVPMSQNSYALIYQFMKQKRYHQIDELAAFMQQNRGREFHNKRILNQVGYQLLKTSQCNWSVALFEINTQMFPTDGNLFDSLGEAAMQCGKSDKAEKNFRRALELAPSDGCIWCANSRQNLLKLSNRN